MEKEINALKTNKTYELAKLQTCKTCWIYTIKTNNTANEQFKARFVAKSYSQKAGIDYHETFTPMSCLLSVRTLMQLAIQHNLFVHQMDVKMAYLNTLIDCKVYIQQPMG